MVEPRAWNDWEERVLRLEHLVTSGQIAAEAAHQINNCLEGIKNYLYLLRLDLPQLEQSPALRVIEEEVLRIAEMSGHMAGLQRSGWPGQRQPGQPVRKLLERVLQLLSGRLRQLGIVVQWGPFDESFSSAAGSELTRIFFNLVLNAVESMPRGGSIHLGAYRHSKGLTILLRDEGCGMDAAELERLFVPFSSNKPQKLGLGLFVCRSLASRIEAELEIKSQPGVGTAAALHLSRESPAEAPPSPGTGPLEM